MKPPIGSEVNWLSSYLSVQWNDVKYIWNNSYLYCGCRWKWRVIITVNFPIQSIGKNKSENISNSWCKASSFKSQSNHACKITALVNWSLGYLWAKDSMSQWVNELVQLPKPIKWKLTLTPKLFLYWLCLSLAHDSFTHLTYKTSVLSKLVCLVLARRTSWIFCANVS